MDHCGYFVNKELLSLSISSDGSLFGYFVNKELLSHSLLQVMDHSLVTLFPNSNHSLFQEMGFICHRRLVFKPRFKRPLRGYKKLVAQMFSKFKGSQPRNWKLVKLCEYASNNPFHILEITRLLEKRFFKELQHGRVKIVNIVMDTYNMLLSMCRKEMGCYVASLLTLTDELLDPSKQVSLQIDGCRTLTRFIYSQDDRSYAPYIDRYVKRVCELAREKKEEYQELSLTASCLQCLSAMVWYMDAFFRTSDDIGEVVHVMLDHYEVDTHNEGQDAGVSDASASFRPRERKNISSLTSEEIQDPGIWAQICLQNMAELAKESTTMRHVLGPMMEFFDNEHHWSPQLGLAMKVLCDMSYFAQDSGKQLLILKGVIRHMDHKNVARDPAVKSWVVEVALNVVHEMKFGSTLSDVIWVNDLLRHLSKSLQVTSREEDDANVKLQSSVTCCLLEIAKGIDNPGPLFNVMIISLDNVPSVAVGAQGIMGSVLTLAHVIVSVYYTSEQIFPDELLSQLLKVMAHQDTEVRIFAHRIFSLLLSPSYEKKRLDSVALLQKETNDGNVYGLSLTSTSKNSIMYKVHSIIDQTARAIRSPEEPHGMKINEDQILLLLCAFWLQINFTGNLPPNFEAIAHSYCSALISSDIQSSSGSLVEVSQLLLSMRGISLSSNSGMLPPACRRAIVVTSTAMLLFAASWMKYPLDKLNDILRPEVLSDVDPYLGINEELQLYVKPQADVCKYGSSADNQEATSFLSQFSVSQTDFMNVIVSHLSSTVKMEEDELLSHLSAPFSPNDIFLFTPKDVRELYINQVQDRLDDDLSNSSVLEADVTSA